MFKKKIRVNVLVSCNRTWCENANTIPQNEGSAQLTSAPRTALSEGKLSGAVRGPEIRCIHTEGAIHHSVLHLPSNRNFSTTSISAGDLAVKAEHLPQLPTTDAIKSDLILFHYCDY